MVELTVDEGDSEVDFAVGVEVDGQVVDELFDLSALRGGANGGVLVGGGQDFDEATAGSGSTDGDLVVVDAPVISTHFKEGREESVTFDLDLQNGEFVGGVGDKEGLEFLVDEGQLVSVGETSFQNHSQLFDEDLNLGVQLGIAGGGVQQGFEQDAVARDVQFNDGGGVLVLDKETDCLQVEHVAAPFGNVGVQDQIFDFNMDLNEDFKLSPDGNQLFIVGQTFIVDDFVLAFVDEDDPSFVDLNLGDFETDVEEVLEQKAVVIIGQQAGAGSLVGAGILLGSGTGGITVTITFVKAGS